MTLQIEKSLLYIQPIFVRAAEAGIPELKKVVVFFDEDVVLGDSFEEALGQLFGAEAPPAPDEPPEGGEEPPRGGPQGRLGELVARANSLYERAQEALAAGDFESYGRLIEQLGEVLAEAEARR